MADLTDGLTTAEELLNRKSEIEARLEDLGAIDVSTAAAKPAAAASTKRGSPRRNPQISETTENDSDDPPTTVHLIPYSPKTTDTHWDFVMKEMMWLGADFQGERKRQVSLAKKLASSVKQFHKTKEARRLRELHQAEMKRRKLAAKIGRDVRSWWTKIEKVISYKQKLLADEERQAAMNKQLVVLVQQTEKYTESLTQHAVSEDDDDGSSDDDVDMETGESEIEDTTDDNLATSDSDTGRAGGSDDGRRRRRRQRRRRRMTIEEALAAQHTLERKSKKRVIDYSRMRLEGSEFYGESTASDGSGSDGSYSPGEENGSENDSDDDSTFRQAMHEELIERNQDETSTFLADPEELRKLREEVSMDIDDVMERLRLEGQQEATSFPKEVESWSMPGTPTRENKTEEKRVHFSETVQEKIMSPLKVESKAADAITSSTEPAASEPSGDPVSKYDADDDADASDVEDYDDAADQRSDEEFEAEEPEADDETTIAQEESLPREMSTEDELALLQKEGDLPIEELRKMYSNLNQKAASADASDEDIEKDDSSGDGQAPEPSGAAMLAEAIQEEKAGSESEGSEEYEFVEVEAVDDETTIDAEERLGRDMSYDDEIALLKRESEMSIEELRAKYNAGLDAEDDQEEDDKPTLLDDFSKDDDDGGEEEFEPDEADAMDDETTLEAEERLGREMSHEEEMDLLKRDSEIPVEQLRAMYASMNADDEDSDDGGEEQNESDASDRSSAHYTSALLAQQSENDDDDDFVPVEADAVDDETTIEAEERLGREMTHEEEIALLKRESEMSVEELRAMYAGMENEPESAPSDEEMGDAEGDEEQESVPNKRKRNHVDEDELGKNFKVEEAGATSDDGLAALNALEASAQRAQRTLASRPFLLAGWVKMRHYQQVGLNWLVSLQSRRLNGILADEMGLGKTLQTIALLAYLASYKGIWGPHLIVVPTSVIINWETELKRFCPALKVLCYYGSAKRRKELRQGWTKTNWYHVVITSYQLAVQDAFAFKRKKWYYLVLDEAQNIKNFQSQRWQTLINFNSQRRLLLTGTPLQNNLMELWSLLHFLMPYIFRSRKEFSYWFSNPMNNIIEGTASRNDDVIKRLHGIIRPFVLRRLKKDVETQMPGKYEHIVKCQLSRRQMTLYEEFLSRSSTRMALKKGGNFMGMMNVLMQLRKVCNHPDLFEPRSVVTPFVLPSLSLTVPSFLCTATESPSVMNRLSLNLLQPVWCGSGGLPSIDGCLRHDSVESDQLRRLSAQLPVPSVSLEATNDDCPDELKDLVRQVSQLRATQADANTRFQNGINKKRCHAPPFPYPNRLLSALEIECSVFQRSESVELKDRTILLTPESLLNMRKKEHDRADEMEEIIGKFVFCVPPAGARTPLLDAGNASSAGMIATKKLDEMLLEPVEELLVPYRKAQARLSSFFPDKKLIQFDSGKLQTLAVLLRDLKQGGHRALIFTQMSKMLDILEAFLNIHGHTYLRLDGATGVDRRQRYMDRFNNDSKIFCFILSTRSGGMGINLTGADSVIFFDSDWNPAMDAQAQDRAHRIGQTRDVHIYRLITEHSIEENIFLKAQQKKNLDILVMDQGKFDASHQLNGAPVQEMSGADEMKDVYTKGGLRAILGVEDDSPEETKEASTENGTKDGSAMSKEQMELAMASLEDEDDVRALRGAQKEAAEELQEFDENAEIKKESDAEDDEDEDGDEDGNGGRPKKKQKKAKEEKPAEPTTESINEQSELEKEFAAWQTTVGFDAAAIESSLTPTERYGLLFRENFDPFYSIFYINELRRKSEATETHDEIDIEEIEREKAMEERRAMDDGDLLATRPHPENLIRQRNLYQREKARLRSDKKRRRLTGENWVQRKDAVTKIPFWYNEDTGEAIWDTPAVLIELQAEELASKRGWGSLQIKILAKVMEFLVPYPERQCCSLVCKQWKTAANDYRFIRHVYPVEMGALSRDPSRREYNHYGSIQEALSFALPGDTIELSDGHYWVTDAGLLFDKPLKLIGDEHNAANVVLEMSGSVIWTGRGGFVEGVTFRRPKITSAEQPSHPMLKIEGQGRVDIVHSVLDNEGSTGDTVVASGSGRKGDWTNVTIRNGGAHGIHLSGEGALLELHVCTVRGNKNSGIRCSDKGTLFFTNGVVRNNGGFGMEIASEGAVNIHDSRFTENSLGVLQRESGCNMASSGNVAFVKKPPGPGRGYPGFRLLTKGQESAFDNVAETQSGEAPPEASDLAPEESAQE